MRRTLRGSGVRYGFGGLVLGLAVSWMMGADRGPAAKAGTTPVEQGGTIAFTTSAGGPTATQWLYLIDTKAQAFAVYRVDPTSRDGAVKLEAARQYRWDLKLTEYNNQKPEVAAIEAMVGSPRH